MGAVRGSGRKDSGRDHWPHQPADPGGVLWEGEGSDDRTTDELIRCTRTDCGYVKMEGFAV